MSAALQAAGKRTPIAELLEHTWIMQYTPAPTEARISAFRGHASLALPTSPASASSPDAASPTPGLSAQASATKISVPDSLAQTIRPKEREVKQAVSALSPLVLPTVLVLCCRPPPPSRGC